MDLDNSNNCNLFQLKNIKLEIHTSYNDILYLHIHLHYILSV